MVHKGFLHRILFLDIETVPSYPDFSKVPESERLHFDTKTRHRRKEGITATDFYRNAGIWAEFGKIVCISTGHFKKDRGSYEMVVRSFLHKEERNLLLEFKSLLESEFSSKSHLLCAHNGKEFDFPFLARRMIIHRISLPEILNLAGKKPWQVRHLDTMELWKFGDYKHFTSLDLLSHVLGIASPKQDLCGEDVARVYYEEGDTNRIKRYCEQDVVSVARVYLRLRGIQPDFQILKE